MIGLSPSMAALLSGYCLTLGGILPVNFTGSMSNKPQSVFPLAQTVWSLRSSLWRLCRFIVTSPSLKSRLASMYSSTSHPRRASWISSHGHSCIVFSVGPTAKLTGSVCESWRQCPPELRAIFFVYDLRDFKSHSGTVVNSAPVSIRKSTSNWCSITAVM